LVEAKSGPFAGDLHRAEEAKIHCGREHFEALQVRETPANYVTARSLDDVLARIDS
jgi:type III restriction enzyme